MPKVIPVFLTFLDVIWHFHSNQNGQGIKRVRVEAGKNQNQNPFPRHKCNYAFPLPRLIPGLSYVPLLLPSILPRMAFQTKDGSSCFLYVHPLLTKLPWFHCIKKATHRSYHIWRNLKAGFNPNLFLPTNAWFLWISCRHKPVELPILQSCSLRRVAANSFLALQRQHPFFPMSTTVVGRLLQSIFFARACSATA